jgi:nitroreductase
VEAPILDNNSPLAYVYSMDNGASTYSICEVIQKRSSCRAFTEQPVPTETLRYLLETAKWAPSGANHQPTQIAVLGEKTRAQLTNRLLAQFDAGALINPDYDFCPDSWADAYKLRRKACGQALYQSLGIAMDNVEAKKRHKRRNYHFFEAPIALIVFIDSGMPKGSWLDVGLFLQNFLIAAEGVGLATCALGTFAEYPDVVRAVLSLENVDIICGIALGYKDLSHPLNSYRTARIALKHFTHWYE